MAEKRIVRFDFSGEEPKVLSAQEEVKRKPTSEVTDVVTGENVAEVKEKKKPNKSISPEKRKAINEGIKKSHDVLNPREKKFCQLYVEKGVGSQAIIEAGFNVANADTASVYANRLLKLPRVVKEITRLQKKCEDKVIADSIEVMQYFTKVMRGEVKDQFGIEAPLSERTKAAMEIAKRTIDIDNRIKSLQQGENTVTIKLDWKPTVEFSAREESTDEE